MTARDAQEPGVAADTVSWLQLPVVADVNWPLRMEYMELPLLPTCNEVRTDAIDFASTAFVLMERTALPSAPCSEKAHNEH